MAVVIRLSRGGANNKPFYHIVVANKDFKRDGRYLARIGTFDPKVKELKDRVKIDLEQLAQWKAKGAIPSETVGHLIKLASESK